jgi:hypothetical protein
MFFFRYSPLTPGSWRHCGLRLLGHSSGVWGIFYVSPPAIRSFRSAVALQALSSVSFICTWGGVFCLFGVYACIPVCVFMTDY